MLYKGPGTDIERGGRQADQYGFLTNNMLDTLKRYGNILVSVKRYNTVLTNICKKKYNETIDIVGGKEISNHERVLIGKCHKELMAELIRLTGFKSFSIRHSESTTNDETPCLIFERDIESNGDTDGDINRCVSCGTVMPEGDHICKFCKTIENNEPEIRLVTPSIMTPNIMTPNIISINTTVTPIEFRVETTADLFVHFAKYYIFKTNMNSNGTFNHRFIRENVQKNEDLLSCETRLNDEYNRTVELIESLIIKK